jgi:hypothetical protein
LNRAIQHLRGNAIAYLALFVALGGTSYAALNLPAGSVGAKQIKNHAITPVKFNSSAIGASVRFWAIVDARCRVIASSPKAKTLGWGGGAGIVTWSRPIPSSCFSLATVDGVSAPEGLQIGFASTATDSSEVGLHMFAPSGAPDTKRVNVAVLCP